MESGENMILRTKKEIEEEFKNLKFIHSHESMSMNNKLFDSTPLNGTFKNNVIISIADDIFIPFSHSLVIIDTLKDFWSVYEEKRMKENVIIDSRAIEFIMYGIIKYSDDLLIYDAYNGSVVSIYTFCSKFFNVQTNEIFINQIKQLCYTYLLLSVYVKPLDFEWNTMVMIKCIKENDSKIINGHNDLNIFDVLIEYCKVKTTSTISSNNVKLIIEMFEKYLSDESFDVSSCKIEKIEKWELKKIKHCFYISKEVAKQENPVILSLARSGIKIRDI